MLKESEGTLMLILTILLTRKHIIISWIKNNFEKDIYGDSKKIYKMTWLIRHITSIKNCTETHGRNCYPELLYDFKTICSIKARNKTIPNHLFISVT